MKQMPRRLVLGGLFMATALVASAASITVTELRLLDQRIQADVMSVLARNTELSGRVVVEAKDQVVTLSGHLATHGQVRRGGGLLTSIIASRHCMSRVGILGRRGHLVTGMWVRGTRRG